MIINKNIKGITLIALIITIIVLLILAGVTLSSLFGQDSIIGKAKEAADKWNNAIDDENEYFKNIGGGNNGQQEEEEPIVETNPDFFTYSSPNENDEVLVTGFTTGVGSGEEAYNNNDETVLKLVIPKQNKEGKNINGIADYAFRNKTKITKLVLQDNIIEIGWEAFLGCTGITNLTVPITVNEFKSSFVECTNISKIKLTKGKNGDTEGKDFTGGYSDYENTPWYKSETESLDIEIENGITKIGSAMFYQCTNLRNIVFPDSIRSVGVWAFNGCSKMQLNGSKIKNLTSIGERAFYGCVGLTGKVEINSAITQIPVGVFQGCTGITEVDLPKEVETIGYDVFLGCTGISNVTVPITINEYSSSFNECINISKVKLIKGKNGDTEGKDFGTYWSYSNYNGNTPWLVSETENLDIEIENGITKIGTAMFAGCTNLRNIVFPDSIRSVGTWAFNGCSKMQLNGSKIKNLTSIGERAFYGCVGLTGKVEINSAITQIPVGVFQGCTGITELYLPKEVETIGYDAFLGCTGISNVTLPIIINEFNSSFAECTNIKKIRLTTGKNDTEGKDYYTYWSYSNYNGNTPWYISRENNPKIIIEKGITKIGAYTFEGIINASFYYTGTSSEWAQVTGTEGISISSSNFNYSE